MMLIQMRTWKFEGVKEHFELRTGDSTAPIDDQSVQWISLLVEVGKTFIRNLFTVGDV